MERECTSCSETKPLSEYHRDSRSPGGYRNQCKTCRLAGAAQWYAANRDRQAGRRRRFVKANRASVRQQDRERYERNKEARIDLVSAVFHSARARVQGAEFDPKLSRSVLRARDGDQCHYCGVTMDFVWRSRKFKLDKATIEHLIPISKKGPHTGENVVLACWGCNREKRAEDVESFRERIRARQPS